MTKSELEAKCAELEKELGKANADCQRACTLLQEQEDEAEQLRQIIKRILNKIHSQCVDSDIGYCDRTCIEVRDIAREAGETDSPRRRWEREVVEAAKGWREWLLRTKQHDEFANDEGLLDSKLAEEPRP